MEFDELSNRVIGCAIEVHRHFGTGVTGIRLRTMPGLKMSSSVSCPLEKVDPSELPTGCKYFFVQSASLPGDAILMAKRIPSATTLFQAALLTSLGGFPSERLSSYTKLKSHKAFG